MNLEQHIQKFKNKKILVVGDIGLDEYVNGSVKRISPEAPVPVVEVHSEEQRLGLATNVAQNIQSLGGVAVLISVVGHDYAGDQLRKLLREANVSDQYLVTDNSRPTTKKLRVMSEHHHVVRVDYEQKRFLSSDVEKKVLEMVQKNIPDCEGLILQDYAKGVFSEKLIQEIIKSAKQKNKKIIVDPHRSTPVEYYRGSDLMTPNAEEAIILSKIPADDLRGVSSSYKEVGDALMKAIGSKQMVVTRGKEGMSFFEDGKSDTVPTVAREVFDVTGAGDTVVAAMALAWCSGVSLRESCLIANHAAGVVVAKIGCATCDISELKTSFANNPS
ncbi:MAG: D-glycero-beta-D-manno-heptose-7-phosphate kinase [Bdellovibrionota bacterium]